MANEIEDFLVYGRLSFADTLLSWDERGHKKAKLLVPKAEAPLAKCVTPSQLKQNFMDIIGAKFPGVKPSDLKLGLKDADKIFHKQTGEPYAGYPGNLELGITATKKNGLAVARAVDGQKVIVAEEDHPVYLYSGAWVVASVGISSYDFIDPATKMKIQGVKCWLNNVILFVKHDDRLGRPAADPDQMFEGIPLEDDGSEDAGNYDERPIHGTEPPVDVFDEAPSREKMWPNGIVDPPNYTPEPAPRNDPDDMPW